MTRTLSQPLFRRHETNYRRLLFSAKFLVALARRKDCGCSFRFGSGFGDQLRKPRIFPQRIPEWIEPELASSETVSYFKKMRKNGERGVEVAKMRVHLRQHRFCKWFG